MEVRDLFRIHEIVEYDLGQLEREMRRYERSEARACGRGQGILEAGGGPVRKRAVTPPLTRETVSCLEIAWNWPRGAVPPEAGSRPAPLWTADEPDGPAPQGH